MASSNEKPALHDQSPPQQRGTPPPAQPDHSGLQVVESGLEVAGSDQSQVLSTGSSPSNLPYHHPQQQQSPFRQASPVQYAEQKGYGWNGAPPPQVVPIEQTGVGGYPGGPNRLHSASTGTSQQHQYLGGHNPFDPATGKPEKDRICGLKKVVFWGLLAAIIFAMVLALAIGLGVGLAVRNSSGRYGQHLLYNFSFPRCRGFGARSPCLGGHSSYPAHGHGSSRTACKSEAARLACLTLLS